MYMSMSYKDRSLRRASACLPGRTSQALCPTQNKAQRTPSQDGLWWPLPSSRRCCPRLGVLLALTEVCPNTLFSGPGSASITPPLVCKCLLGQGFPKMCLLVSRRLQLSPRASASSEEDFKMCVLISWCSGFRIWKMGQ